MSRAARAGNSDTFFLFRPVGDVHRNPDAPGLQAADAGEAVDFTDVEAVTEVAHKVTEMTAGDRSKLMAKVQETIELVDRVDTFFAKREELLRKGA